jgi:hypothetical protein
MHLLSFTTPFLSLLALTTALPTPQSSSPSTAIVQRQNPGIQNNIGNGGDCVEFVGVLGSYLGFQIHVWGPWLATDYGQGLLDNLRGQCGWIQDWGFTYWADGSGFVTFTTWDEIPYHCVESAIHEASKNSGAIEGLQCQFNESAGS